MKVIYMILVRRYLLPNTALHDSNPRRISQQHCRNSLRHHRSQPRSMAPLLTHYVIGTGSPTWDQKYLWDHP